MAKLSEQRCANHAGREAVARCLECGRTFCRECVTEHEDRVICAACLKKLARAEKRPRRRAVRRLGGLALLILNFLILYGVFDGVGRALIAIPDPTHERALWREWISRLE